MGHSKRHRDKHLGLPLLLVILVLTVISSVPLWADGGFIFLVGLLLIQTVFALSYNILFGLTGLVSFGQAALFATGAYAAAYLMRIFPDIPFLLALLAGGLAGGAIAALIGVVALRRASGIYFAILTLALGQLVYTMIGKSTALGREDGMTGIARPVLNFFLFEIDLSVGDRYFFFILAACAVVAGLLWWVWYGRIGRILYAVRQDPERVRFLGINVQRYREIAFIISGITTAFAGALLGPWQQILTPEIADWSYSALPILMCLLGGATYYWGPAAGAVLFVGLSHATRMMPGISELLIGGVLLLVVLAVPGGVAAGLARIGKPWRRSKEERVYE